MTTDANALLGKLPKVYGPMSELFRSIEAAEGYLVLGMAEDARACLQKLPEDLGSHISTMPCRLKIQRQMGNWAAAGAIAEVMAGKFPEDPVWWLEWASCIREVEGVESAQWVLSQAVRVHPHTPSILYNLACCTCVLGKVATARRLLGMAFGLDPGLEAEARGDADLSLLYPGSIRTDLPRLHDR